MNIYIFKRLNLLVLTTMLFLLSTPLHIHAEETPRYIPGEVIIKLKEQQTPQTLFNQRYSQRKRVHKAILSRLKAEHKLKEEKPVFEGLHKQLKAKNLTQN